MEQSSGQSISQLISEAAVSASISIRPEHIGLFSLYVTELRRWNQSINLTAIDDDREIVIKHLIDSLAAVRWVRIPTEASVLDIGTGAGFPGMPIKLVRPDIFIDFLEPNEKKAAFLRYLIGTLKLNNAKVISCKIEDCSDRIQGGRAYDCIVVRAFKVDSYGEVIRGLLKPGGVLVLYRAARVEPDFRLEGLALLHEVEYELPSGLGHRVLSIFSSSSR